MSNYQDRIHDAVQSRLDAMDDADRAPYYQAFCEANEDAFNEWHYAAVLAEVEGDAREAGMSAAEDRQLWRAA